MNKRIEIEAKTEKEALKTAVAEFRVLENLIKIDVIKEKKGLFGGLSKYLAYVDVDLLEAGRKQLEMILTSLGVEFQMESRAINDNNELYYEIDTNENALLIGKEGRCLDAMQVLLKTYLGNFVQERLILSVDIGGYKANRTRQLEILATKVAKEVARTNVEVRLKPMSAYERRIIHAKLGEWRDVRTESEGEGASRCLVVKPKK